MPPELAVSNASDKKSTAFLATKDDDLTMRPAYASLMYLDSYLTANGTATGTANSSARSTSNISVASATSVLAVLERQYDLRFSREHIHTPRAKNVFIAVVVVVAILAAIRYALSHMIRAYIESIDRDLIGVDIHIKKLYLGRMMPILHITFEDLKVCNPKGYHADYLLEASSLVLVIDAWKFLRSRCVDVEIKECSCTELVVNFEKSWTTHKSNVSEIIHFLYYGTGSEELPASEFVYQLHRLTLEDFEIVSRFNGVFGSSEFHIPAEQIVMDDVAKDARLETVLRSIVSTILHRVQERHAVHKLQRSWRRGMKKQPSKTVLA